MKIPPHAKRVFKGILYDVYHWEQEMFDGTTEIFEGLKRQTSVNIIATNGDKIVYAEERQPFVEPFVTMFGGKCEQGEEPLEAAKRELLEESGLVSDDWEQISLHDDFSVKLDWSVYAFVARNVKKISDQKLDAGENIQVKEATLEEFLDIASRGNFRNKEWTLDLLKWRFLEPEKLQEFKNKLFKK